ncbi:hypothetical protein, partial [Sphingorhabdus sp.]|uniref:hypothetical protein n=1 Tax=Sphingorhabdus sp. TaxID=1902408 RepID=UPI0032B83751
MRDREKHLEGRVATTLESRRFREPALAQALVQVCTIQPNLLPTNAPFLCGYLNRCQCSDRRCFPRKSMKMGSMKTRSTIQSRSARSRRIANGWSKRGRTPRRHLYDLELVLYTLPFMLTPAFYCLINTYMGSINTLFKGSSTAHFAIYKRRRAAGIYDYS